MPAMTRTWRMTAGLSLRAPPVSPLGLTSMLVSRMESSFASMLFFPLVLLYHSSTLFFLILFSTLPHFTFPYLHTTFTYYFYSTLPHLSTPPHLTSPHLTPPHLTSPYLCRLANKLTPGSCKIQKAAAPFVQMVWKERQERGGEGRDRRERTR